LFDFAFGWFFVSVAVLDEVLLVVLLVAVKVFAAREVRLEQDHDAEEHFRGNVCDDLGVLFELDSLLIAEDFFDQFGNLFLRLNTIQEYLTEQEKIYGLIQGAETRVKLLRINSAR
jgi:hypothetical protein